MAAPTSFTKRVKAKVRQIQGTKPSLYNNQLLVSTGVPSLDSVLGMSEYFLFSLNNQYVDQPQVPSSLNLSLLIIHLLGLIW
jgi:hypothetical protein